MTHYEIRHEIVNDQEKGKEGKRDVGEDKEENVVIYVPDYQIKIAGSKNPKKNIQKLLTN